jgi:hypothetical protein
MKAQVIVEEKKGPRSDTSFIGAAGVHYAAYRLARKRMIALPTIRNTPGADLVVTSRDGRRYANIQVKTSDKRVRFWPVCSAKKFKQLPFGRKDYYLLLRPCGIRDGEGGSDQRDEFERFLLTAREAKRELEAQLRYWKGKPKFSLCIYVDKGKREQKRPWPPDSHKKWRKRWQEFQI